MALGENWSEGISKMVLNPEECTRYLQAGIALKNTMLNHPLYRMAPDIQERIGNITEYFMKQMDHTSGPLIVAIYNRLVSSLDKAFTTEFCKKQQPVMVTAWCYELLQSNWKLIGEIVEPETVTSGKGGWAREESQIKAMNDAFFVESIIWNVLREYLHEDTDHLVGVSSIFHEASQTFLLERSSGRSLQRDAASNEELQRCLIQKNVARSKCTFEFPMKIATILAGQEDSDIVNSLSLVCEKMGELSVGREEVEKFFCHYEDTHQDWGSISYPYPWIFTTSWKKADEYNREVLKKHWMKEDFQSMRKVMDVVRETDVKGEFLLFEAETFKEVNASLEAVQRSIKSMWVGVLFGLCTSK